MFTAEEKKRIKKRYDMALDRITNTNIKCFEEHEKPLFLISNTYPGVWLEHAYDSVFLAKLDNRYLEIAKKDNTGDGSLCYVFAGNTGDGSLCYAFARSGIQVVCWFTFMQ